MVEVVINLSCYNLSNHLRDEIQIGNGTSIFKFLMVKWTLWVGRFFKALGITALSKDKLTILAKVVQTLDSAFHRINHYPADKYYGNQLRYPLDSDLSGG